MPTPSPSTNPPSKHNQPIPSPLIHFKSIPWCASLIQHPTVIPSTISPPNRTPLASTESALVRETLNTFSTVRACVTFFRLQKPPWPEEERAKNGEDGRNPFLEMVALLDLGKGVNGYAGTAHGGFLGVVLDEVMGTAANLQAANGAYTATLTVNFRRPLFTPSIVVVRGQVLKKEGKKIHVKGSLEDKEGKVLADARGLWVCVEEGRDIGRWTTQEQQRRRGKEGENDLGVKAKL